MRTKLSLAIALLLFAVGIWDVVAIGYYMRSSLQLLGMNEGFDRVYIVFHLPTNGQEDL